MRNTFLGCPIDILTMAETVDLARDAMRTRKRLRHVALNVAKLVTMRRDPLLAADVKGSDLVGVDGMGIVWSARFLGLPIKDRVAGIDLLDQLLAVCADEGLKPYFLGATRETVNEAASQVLNKYPTLRFAGIRDGYFIPAQELDVVAEIRESGADCLFIGMPTPRKERFLAAHCDEINIPFIMGVGGSFDVIAGKVRRAPIRMQQLGLEWLYRVYQEPRRMWWRYVKTNTVFAVLMMQAFLHQNLRSVSRPSRGTPAKSSGSS
jgi:N-acetylglucosaminyldiphosphoundecaprenol N-acetyl-beta-D-mannosaminyltransferase